MGEDQKPTRESEPLRKAGRYRNESTTIIPLGKTARDGRPSPKQRSHADGNAERSSKETEHNLWSVQQESEQCNWPMQSKRACRSEDLCTSKCPGEGNWEDVGTHENRLDRAPKDQTYSNEKANANSFPFQTGSSSPLDTRKEDLMLVKNVEEQAKLTVEMDKRRKRIEQWQHTRRRQKDQEEAAIAKVTIEADISNHKNWNLDADDSDDEAILSESKPHHDSEDDPLDVFMAGIDMKVSVQKMDGKLSQCGTTSNSQADAGAMDPLDAYMQANVDPEDHDDSNISEEKRITDDAKVLLLNTKLDAGTKRHAHFSIVKAFDNTGETDSLPEDHACTQGSKSPIVRRKQLKLKLKQSKRKRQRAKTASMHRGGLGMAGGQYADSSASDTDESNYEEEETEIEWKARTLAGKPCKSDKLLNTDRNIHYPPFRRNFYIEATEIAKMSDEAVKIMRAQQDDIKVRGQDVPKPIRTWTQCGLSNRVLEMIKKLGFEAPLPIQAQAIPAIMSGRDVIGIAKTGSGKTMAFVLPMLRHIKDQPPLKQNDGMIGLILAPTRELVGQIMRETRRFAKPLDMQVVAVYGGSGVAQQISDLKRGAEIVVCTPGRMIDILATGTGKITNLRRVTYLVLDEADRMFDMGFEPQIDRVLLNTRPDHQCLLFSATFPHQVEILAKKVLDNPIEIQVGGRSVVNPDIDQRVEIRLEDDRFLRLLELLGEWYEVGKVLVFVHSQEKCDQIFRELLKSGYPCLSLHGGKDQLDRESTISDFKGSVCNLIIATSVAARGLDVKDLMLVVNYDVPNHYEDYVHRVGRTGRAGVKGTAITFITPEEEKYAPDLIRALKESGRAIPKDLQDLSEVFLKKKKEGLVQGHGTGYGGSGFKFDDAEAAAKKRERKANAIQYGLNEDDDDVFSASDSDEEIVRTTPGFLGPSLGSSGGSAKADNCGASMFPQTPQHAAITIAAQQAAQNVQAKMVVGVPEQVHPVAAGAFGNKQVVAHVHAPMPEARVIM